MIQIIGMFKKLMDKIEIKLKFMAKIQGLILFKRQ